MQCTCPGYHRFFLLQQWMPQKRRFLYVVCNMSFWKSDLIRINGYDESMVGWGREDSEIAARLVHAGVIKKRLKFAGIQFHQFHNIQTRKGLNVNDEILNETLKKRKIRCENGLSNHC